MLSDRQLGAGTAPHQGPQKALKTHASSHLLSFSARLLPRSRKRGVKSESYASTWATLLSSIADGQMMINPGFRRKLGVPYGDPALAEVYRV